MASMSIEGQIGYLKGQEKQERDERRRRRIQYDTRRAESLRRYTQQQAQNIGICTRNHEQNAAAEVARRRQEFIREKQQRKLEEETALLPALQKRKNDELGQIIIEDIYADLQHHYLHPKEISMKTCDTYSPRMTPRVTRQRFDDAMQTLGLEFLSILMISKMFCNSMQRFGITVSGEIAVVGDQEYADYGTWDTLLEKLLSERSSISFCPQSSHSLYRCLQKIRRRRAGYAVARARRLPARFEKPIRGLSRSRWKASSESLLVKLAECVSCGKWTGPPTGSIRTIPSTSCSCSTATMFSEILIEIKEYDSYVPGSLNRGVRALQSFPRGCILGEYLDEFIPLNTQEERGDEIYAMEFGRPSYIGQSSASSSENIAAARKDDAFPIATLIAGANGSWTRFINAPSEGEVPNCALGHEVLAGKLTITLRAMKHIRFGEQLLVDYGEDYWSGVGKPQLQAESSRVQSSMPARSSAKGAAWAKSRFSRFCVEEA